MPLQKVYMPNYPGCWKSCGTCASGEIFILEVLVEVGDTLQVDDNILTLETGKVSLDIPSPHAGKVVEVHVIAGDEAPEGALLITLETAS